MCNCIDAINEKLEPLNGKLTLTFAIRTGAEFPTIQVEKIKPRGGRPPLAIPSYCPFCGDPYASAEGKE